MIDVSVFEVLVLIGLVLLVLALGITAFVVVRRPRKSSPESPTSSRTTPLQVAEGDPRTVGSGQQAGEVAGDRLSDDLNARGGGADGFGRAHSERRLRRRRELDGPRCGNSGRIWSAASSA